MLPLANGSVIFQKVADGAVLFAPGQEIYFGLNEVGAKVWQLLPPACGSIDELCGRLAAVYPDVPPATLRSDIEELLSELVREGLAEPHASVQGADGAVS